MGKIVAKVKDIFQGTFGSTSSHFPEEESGFLSRITTQKGGGTWKDFQSQPILNEIQIEDRG